MNKAVFDAIKKQGMLPLFFNADVLVCIDLMKTLYSAGVRVIEFTNRGAEALDNFKQMLVCKNAEMPDLLLGIGTIKNAHDATGYLDAGADFLISPCFADDILQVVNARKATWIPGCMTPTEINNAEQKGIGFIKLFPGDLLQPQFMSAIKGLFPQMDCMPTGGVDVEEENIRHWFNAGVCAVGMGSKLISKNAMANKDYETIKAQTKKAFNIIQSIKSKQ